MPAIPTQQERAPQQRRRHARARTPQTRHDHRRRRTRRCNHNTHNSNRTNQVVTTQRIPLAADVSRPARAHCLLRTRPTTARSRRIDSRFPPNSASLRPRGSLPHKTESDGRAGVAASGVKQQRVCGPARPCHRPGQSTTLTIASTVVTSPSARAQWRRDPCPPRASRRDCIGIASAPTALSGSLAMGGDHCVESPARVVARVADDRRLFGRRL